MEQKLSKEELLEKLIKKAIDPFTSGEEKDDIYRILLNSDSFSGKNHLYLVKCYFQEVDPVFLIDKETAILQAKEAFKEKNYYACYYLFKLLKDDDRKSARAYLRLACDYGYADAYLALAECYHRGEVFSLNRSKASYYYTQAISSGCLKGYYGLLLLASEDGDLKRQLEVIEEAKKSGVNLPGVVM